MVRKLGILANHLGNSQLAYQAVVSVNEYLRANQDTTFLFFALDPMPMTSSPLCPVMQGSECYGFDGPVIATSVETATRLSRIVGPSKRFYYVWDLEWVRPAPVEYGRIKQAMLDPKLELIARNSDHAKLIQNCFNRAPAAIVEDFDIKSLLSVVYP